MYKVISSYSCCISISTYYYYMKVWICKLYSCCKC